MDFLCRWQYLGFVFVCLMYIQVQQGNKATFTSLWEFLMYVRYSIKCQYGWFFYQIIIMLSQDYLIKLAGWTFRLLFNPFLLLDSFHFCTNKSAQCWLLSQHGWFIQSACSWRCDYLCFYIVARLSISCLIKCSYDRDPWRMCMVIHMAMNNI
jgi:hypothetical protein